MDPYRRPEIAKATFVDDTGAEIPYGSRWLRESPPDDTYSVPSNLERFRPLHTIADALIDWLVSTYDVSVDDSPGHSDDLMRHRDDVVRAVRITPRNDEAAALTFVYTSYPSVIVHAGILHDFLFPVCGCDACDESWETTADGLEWTVATVAAGGYGEDVDEQHALGVRFSLQEDGVRSSSGESRSEEFPTDRLAAAVSSLPAGLWAPWRLRRPHETALSRAG